MTDPELDSIRFRWSPKPLWLVLDDEWETEGFLRADTREEAEHAAREEHGEGCAVIRDPDVLPAERQLRYARKDIAALLAEVDRLREMCSHHQHEAAAPRAARNLKEAP